MSSHNLRRPLVPGLSRKEIAERLGLEVGTIAGYEQGRVKVPKPIRLLIKEIWGIELPNTDRRKE